MGFPVDDVFMRSYIQQMRINENKRELAIRLQEDYRVFLSYSRSDRVIAQRMMKNFDERKIHYSVDEKSIDWGQGILDKVKKEIRECTHYLLILSKRSIKSKWCSFEYGFASGQGKNMLVYLRDVAVPDFAKDVLAIADAQKVAEYFSWDLIDAAAVDRLIGEILADPKAKLEAFQRAAELKEGREVWEAPDRGAIEAVRYSEIDAYMDVNPDASETRLVAIELGDKASKKPLVLHYYRSGYQPMTYTFSYNQELTAVVVEPEKECSDRVGVREQMATGEVRYHNRTPSLEDGLYNRIAHGWMASRCFWERTFHKLKDRLPVAASAAKRARV